MNNGEYRADRNDTQRERETRDHRGEGRETRENRKGSQGKSYQQSSGAGNNYSSYKKASGASNGHSGGQSSYNQSLTSSSKTHQPPRSTQSQQKYDSYSMQPKQSSSGGMRASKNKNQRDSSYSYNVNSSERKCDNCRWKTLFSESTEFDCERCNKTYVVSIIIKCLILMIFWNFS